MSNDSPAAAPTLRDLSAAESEELAKALVPLTLPDPLPDDLAWFFRRFPWARGKQ
jgi:hypothetical protein